MKPSEAALVIGCHPSHVRRLIRDKKIKVTSKKLKSNRGRVFQISYNITQKEAERIRDSDQGVGYPRGGKRK